MAASRLDTQLIPIPFHCHSIILQTPDHRPFPIAPLPSHPINPLVPVTHHLASLVVVRLIHGPPAHERRLAAPHVDVLEQDLRGRLRRLHLLGLRDLLVHIGPGLLVDALELLLRHDLPVEQLRLEPRDRVVRAAHPLDLLARAVRGSRVGHRVAAVAVGEVLEHDGAVARDGVRLGVGHGGLDG